MTPEAGRYALDTNVAIALLNGARRSTRKEQNEQAVRALTLSMRVVPCDETVCDRYARIKVQLAIAGRPIPENDLWIAACAVAADATLVTRDAHFSAIDGLRCEEW